MVLRVTVGPSSGVWSSPPAPPAWTALTRTHITHLGLTPLAGVGFVVLWLAIGVGAVVAKHLVVLRHRALGVLVRGLLPHRLRGLWGGAGQCSLLCNMSLSSMTPSAHRTPTCR